MPPKIETIQKVYFEPDGFGSLKETLKDAKKFHATITYEDVRGWKSTQTSGQKNKIPG